MKYSAIRKYLEISKKLLKSAFTWMVPSNMYIYIYIYIYTYACQTLNFISQDHQWKVILNFTFRTWTLRSKLELYVLNLNSTFRTWTLRSELQLYVQNLNSTFRTLIVLSCTGNNSCDKVFATVYGRPLFGNSLSSFHEYVDSERNIWHYNTFI